MIDKASLEAHIRFTIQHHGTRTEGEDHRYDQVAQYLTEMVIQLVIFNQAVDSAMEDMDTATTFSIKVG